MGEQRLDPDVLGAARLIVTGRETDVRTNKKAVVYKCGHNACAKTITIYLNGAQQRGKSGLAPATLERKCQREGIPLITSHCDVHGGQPFPTATAIAVAMGYPSPEQVAVKLHGEMQAFVARGRNPI